MSRRKRDKGEGKVGGRIIGQRRDFLRTFGLAVSTEFLTLWLFIRGGTEFLEVLGMEGQDIH